MEQYISKSAIVAKIESKIKEWRLGSSSEAKFRIEAYKELSEWLNTLEVKETQEEPVSSYLEEAATKYARKQVANPDYPTYNDEYEMECAFEAGAQWQKKHLIDNRIKDCNNITEDQYNLESDFLDDFIDKHDRMPTFLDAIEYGMKLQKEQDQSTIELAEYHAYLAGQEKIIDKACEWLKYNFNMPNDFESHFKKAMEE